jgi:hypothetical protein
MSESTAADFHLMSQRMGDIFNASGGDGNPSEPTAKVRSDGASRLWL